MNTFAKVLVATAAVVAVAVVGINRRFRDAGAGNRVSALAYTVAPAEPGTDPCAGPVRARSRRERT